MEKVAKEMRARDVESAKRARANAEAEAVALAEVVELTNKAKEAAKVARELADSWMLAEQRARDRLQAAWDSFKAWEAVANEPF